MGEGSDEVKRWTARRKATVVLDIIKGKITAAEMARSHDLTVAEVESWMEDFLSQGTEAFRAKPRWRRSLKSGGAPNTYFMAKPSSLKLRAIFL